MRTSPLLAASTALALMASFAYGPTAEAVQILASEASCDGVSTCTIDDIDPVVSPVGSETFDVVLPAMTWIEVVDADGFSLFVEWGIGNPNAVSVMVDVDFAFLDANGDPVGPAIFGFASSIDPGGGTGNYTQALEAPQGGSFEVHGFRIVLSCDECDAMTMLDSSDIALIELSNVDAASRVVPEPSGTILLGLGLALLARRRARRLAGTG